MGSSLISGFQGLSAWEPFAFYPAVSSDGEPRAVKRADRSGLPGAPGRLGYLAAEQLMDWASMLQQVLP